MLFFFFSGRNKEQIMKLEVTKKQKCVPFHSRFSLYFDMPLYTKPSLGNTIIEVLRFPSQLPIFTMLHASHMQHVLKQFSSMLQTYF